MLCCVVVGIRVNLFEFVLFDFVWSRRFRFISVCVSAHLYSFDFAVASLDCCFHIERI